MGVISNPEELVVAFDWSGTISNDLPIVMESVNNIMRHFGRPPVSRQEYILRFGADLPAMYRAWGIYDFDEVNRVHCAFLKNAPRPTPIPGAIDAICETSRNVRRAVVFSAHPGDEIIKDIENWGIGGYIDHVFGGVSKSSDEDFARMLKETKAASNLLLFVGDTTADIDAAKRNLAKSAVVVNPKYCYQEIERVRSHSTKPDYYLTDISALVPLLKNRR
jgi:phosphoglycolate phosphatase-like HAD superfamily hydrolase